MSPAISAQILIFLMLQHTPEFTNGQSGLQLTATPSLLYIYEPVTLDCTFGSGLSLLSGEITVFQGHELLGNLLYTCTGGSSPNSTGTGIFSGWNAAGCEVLGSTSFSVIFYTGLALNLDVNCSATVINTQTFKAAKLSSAILSVVVLSLPGSPQLSSSLLIFNDGQNGTVVCRSYGGVPAASLLLEIKTIQTNELLTTASGVSVTSASWTMSKSYDKAVATCRITNHFRTTSSATAYIRLYGATELTFSSNPVYEYYYTLLSCYFSTDCFVYYNRCVIKIGAYNNTEPMGFLTSEYYSNLIYSTGVFTSSSVSYDWALKRLNVLVTALRSMELDYDCTFNFTYPVPQTLGVTSATHLTVFVAPSPPTLSPGDLIFMDGNLITISCRTYSSGKPAALLQLLVNSTLSAQALTPATGTGFASIGLNVSRAWHDANVSCSVLNHVRSNMNVGGVMKVVHLAANGTPDAAYTYNSDTILDCARHVVGFPEPTFQWSVPIQLNSSDVNALNSRYLLVGKKQSGSFNCTATNPITAKNLTVTFTVHDTPPEASNVSSSQGAIVGGAVGSMAAVATIVCMTVIIIRRRKNKFISRLFTCWLIPKKPEPPANPGNIYTTGTGFAAVTGDAVEYSQSSQHVYGVLGEDREDAGATYSTLDRT